MNYKYILIQPLATMLFVLLMGMSPTNKAFAARIDSLLRVLDRTIDCKDDIKHEKQARIEPLKIAMLKARTDEDRFLLAEKLFKEYKSYSIDTSLLYAIQARNYANRTGNPEYMWRGMLMEAEGQKGMGLYHRSLQILDSLPAEARKSMNYDILERYCSVYYSLCENSTASFDPNASRRHLLEYRDSLIKNADNAVDSAINTIEYNIAKGDYDTAISTYDDVIKSDNPDLQEVRPMLDYVVSAAYRSIGNNGQAMEYLAEASISDLRRGNRRYNALPTLATMLYEKGDIERAYRYIMCSLEDINESKANSRMYRVTDAVPIISKAYEDHETIGKRNRLVINILAGILIALFIVLVLKVVKDNRKLNDEHSKLHQRNSQLAEAKNESDKMKAQLEANGRTKDDSIGALFSLCSDYIHAMSKEHSALVKVSKSGSERELEKVISSMQAPDRLTSFFERFDKIVLNIYPGYVEKFNSLLDADKRIVPPVGRLTPELRIFALMKLGITDTSKIASFLRYTNQTVYNYQFKMRSASHMDKDAFLNAIYSI